MKIAFKYNHLNAEEYLRIRKNKIYKEIKDSIKSIDANQFLKISGAEKKAGMLFYSQDSINKEFEKIMRSKDWEPKTEGYYVTSNEDITREIVKEKDKHEQKSIIENNNLIAHYSYNQVDFQKDEVAVEMQFGKYTFVTYDLHVKHTFFYSRGDINVGVEIIPTKAMEERMDGGVPYFENEVNNVIRGGRTNPPIPILVLGIEPEVIVSCEPKDHTKDTVIKALLNTSSRSMSSLRTNIKKMKDSGKMDYIETERVNIMINYIKDLDRMKKG